MSKDRNGVLVEGVRLGLPEVEGRRRRFKRILGIRGLFREWFGHQWALVLLRMKLLKLIEAVATPPESAFLRCSAGNVTVANTSLEETCLFAQASDARAC